MIDISRVCGTILAVCTAAIFCNCAGLPRPVPRAQSQAHHPAIVESELENDAHRLLELEQAISSQLRSFDRITTEAGASRAELGYFTNRQHDRLERAWIEFRDLSRQASEIASRYEPYRSLRSRQKAASSQRRAGLIGLYADLLSLKAESRFVAMVQRDPQLVAKFNEVFLNAGEPRGGYDRVFHRVSATGLHKRRKQEWRRHAPSDQDAYGNGTVYETMSIRAVALHRGASSIRKEIIARGYRILPEVANAMRHTYLATWLKANRVEIEDAVRSARGSILTGFGNLPIPDARPTRFTPVQTRKLRRLLKPGDVLLSYTGGFASNLVLPGYFKHAFNYVGDRRERRSIGLDPEYVPSIQGVNLEPLRRDLEQESVITTDGIQRADVIESAVPRGVPFNSLNHLLETRITSLVALRPRTTDEELRSYLLRVFSLLGAEYDFHFDFNDASTHCCTEVVYRALNHCGNIEFPLKKRAGHFNMNADAIVQTHYASPEALELVFLAVPDESGNARILLADKAAAELRRLVEPE